MVYKYLINMFIFISSVVASDNIKDLKSFQADFEQSIVSQNNTKIDYKGKVFINKSGKILWKYEQPIIKNVYIYPDFVIVDEPELEQAIYTKLKDEINIINILKESKKIDEHTYLAKIENINYKVLTNGNKIEKILYKNELDNNITINFENVVVNKNIDDTMFKFTAPKYYDIIKEN